MPQAAKLKKYEDVLMAALDFTEADLAANETGEYSRRQIDALKRRRVLSGVAFTSAGAVVSALALLIGMVAASGSGAMLAVFIAALLALTVIVTVINALRVTRDLRDGARVVEGRVELATNQGEQANYYFVNVERVKFRVKKSVFLAFKNGDPYRLYYAPHSKSILSAEWLRDDDPFTEDAPRHDHSQEPPLDIPAETRQRTGGAAE